MYIPLYSATTTSKMRWFQTTGNSTFEIAILYQKGLIKRSHIKSNICNKTLNVLLHNIHEEKINDIPYHLYLLPMLAGAPVIQNCFKYKDFVASWYRPDLTTEVLPETWCNLFEITDDQNFIFPVMCRITDEYFCDLINNIDLDFNCADLFAYVIVAEYEPTEAVEINDEDTTELGIHETRLEDKPDVDEDYITLVRGGTDF